MTIDLLVRTTAEEAAREVGERLARAAASGSSIALAGGSTPRRAYELAAAIQPDWSRAEVWWTDERCVPPEDRRSNFLLVREALLARVRGRPAVHRIRGELAAEAAADEYDRELEGREIDLVLLGLGPDGHTASLFPNAPALAERRRWAVAAAPGLDPFVPRVTLTLPTLTAARGCLFLAAGKEKADAARRAFAASPDPAVPASLVRSARGGTVAVLDAAAAAALDA